MYFPLESRTALIFLIEDLDTVLVPANPCRILAQALGILLVNVAVLNGSLGNSCQSGQPALQDFFTAHFQAMEIDPQSANHRLMHDLQSED